MVQVIGQGRQKPKSTSQQFGEAFSRLGEGASEHLLSEYRRSEEDEALKREYNVDFSGITDPNQRKMLAEKSALNKSNQLKGQSSQDIQSIYAKGLRGEELTDEEMSKLPVNAQTQLNKARNPKEQRTPLSGQSVPPEVSMAANKVIQQFPNASADQLKMMMDEIGIPPAYSNGYVENRRRQDERAAASKDKILESGQKRAEKVLDRADKIGENLPLKESYVNAMEDAVVNEDLSFWTPDNFANITGFEFLRSTKGAQFVSAAKNYFIDDLKSSGARPNMFIEKQLVDALAKVGRSQEANQVVIESFKFKNDLDKHWLETVRNLEKQYDETLGYLPGSLSRVAEETVKPYIQERQKQYESRLKELAIQSKTKSKKTSSKKESKPMIVDVIGPDGSVYEINSDEVELLPEGYKLQ